MAKVKLKKTKESTDATSVKKPSVKEVGPSYKYMGKMGDKTSSKPSSKDTSEYKSGYNKGIYEVSKNPSGKGVIGGKYTYGKRIVGLSDRFNEGFSEGKDVALKRKNK